MKTILATMGLALLTFGCVPTGGGGSNKSDPGEDCVRSPDCVSGSSCVGGVCIEDDDGGTGEGGAGGALGGQGGTGEGGAGGNVGGAGGQGGAGGGQGGFGGDGGAGGGQGGAGGGAGGGQGGAGGGQGGFGGDGGNGGQGGFGGDGGSGGHGGFGGDGGNGGQGGFGGDGGNGGQGGFGGGGGDGGFSGGGGQGGFGGEGGGGGQGGFGGEGGGGAGGQGGFGGEGGAGGQGGQGGAGDLCGPNWTGQVGGPELPNGGRARFQPYGPQYNAGLAAANAAGPGPDGVAVAVNLPIRGATITATMFRNPDFEVPRSQTRFWLSDGQTASEVVMPFDRNGFAPPFDVRVGQRISFDAIEMSQYDGKPQISHGQNWALDSANNEVFIWEPDRVPNIADLHRLVRISGTITGGGAPCGGTSNCWDLEWAHGTITLRTASANVALNDCITFVGPISSFDESVQLDTFNLGWLNGPAR